MTWLQEVRRTLPAAVRVVVLSIRADARSTVGDDLDDLPDATDWHSRPDLVSVAVLRGRVDGPALRLALGCDLRVVTDDVVLDFAPPSGAAQLAGVDISRLARLTPTRVRDLVLAGDAVDARTAVACGLANVRAGVAAIEGVAQDLVDRLLATDRDTAAEAKALLLAAGSGADVGPAQRAAVRRLRAVDDVDRVG